MEKDFISCKKTRSGFSIAEAMIVLLIVSIAIAAMAPMISKRTLRGTSGTCEWIVTQNGTDIARPNSSARIGGDSTTNPTVRLEVISSDVNADIVRIYRTNSGVNLGGITDLVAKIDKNGIYSPPADAPKGMVAYFKEDTTGYDSSGLGGCPSGWAPIPNDATNGDWRNTFLMMSSLNYGTGVHVNPTVNNIQDHYHGMGTATGGTPGMLYLIFRNSVTWVDNSQDYKFEKITSSDVFADTTTRSMGTLTTSKGLPFVDGTTLNPRNVQLLACVKQ